MLEARAAGAPGGWAHVAGSAQRLATQPQTAAICTPSGLSAGCLRCLVVHTGMPWPHVVWVKRRPLRAATAVAGRSRGGGGRSGRQHSGEGGRLGRGDGEAAVSCCVTDAREVEELRDVHGQPRVRAQRPLPASFASKKLPSPMLVRDGPPRAGAPPPKGIPKGTCASPMIDRLSRRRNNKLPLQGRNW